jgi:hypothetical protein
MFFTHVGRVVAIIALVLGILRITMGVMIAEEFAGPYEAALARYGAGAKSAGAIINQGIYATLVALAFGILSDISYALQAIERKT